jgi:putative nucleotidyltransferase with HDIG domain
MLRLAEVIAPLSYALDITEGQPEGHAIRTCMIGMRLAREIYLLPRQRTALFYALLLKDLGCSFNASRITGLFGTDDRQAKSDLKTTNWAKPGGRIGFVLRNFRSDDTLLGRVGRFMRMARSSAAAARELTEMRTDHGAAIARTFMLPDETAVAIQNIDEHWNGQGHPAGKIGEDVPILARIAGLAQTVEIFYRRDGLDGAMALAHARSGSWFDPDLVRAVLSMRSDAVFWEKLFELNLVAEVMRFEPGDRVLLASEEQLDAIAAGFAQIIDAKSHWTSRHSEGVAVVAAGIAQVLGLDAAAVRRIRRAALLHDIGKLSVSNLVLDKPGKLDARETDIMRKHPFVTRHILSRVAGFKELAGLAGAHHERLDGTGYDRGLDASKLTLEMRILALSDMFEALASRRPYREDLSEEEVITILSRQAGSAIDPACFEALKTFLQKTQWEPVELAA